MGAGRVEALLDGRPVDHEVEGLAVDPKVVQQRRALGRRAIGRDPFLFLLERLQQSPKPLAQSGDFLPEVTVELEAGNTGLGLLGLEPCYGLRSRSALRGVEAKRSAVDRQTLPVHD